MGTLTIRNLDDDVKHELRKRAAERGVSMEQEARDIIARDVLNEPRTPKKKATLEEILALGRKPPAPFDQKAFTDELWSYIEDE